MEIKYAWGLLRILSRTSTKVSNSFIIRSFGTWCGRKDQLTDFDELVVCVTPEKTVREEGDDCIDGRHVQDADTTR